MAPDLVAGGWAAISNVIWPSDQPVTGSGFFPTAQRDTIVSEITQPAGGTGQTYRQTSVDAPSIFESVKMALAGWIGTPYQDQYSVPAKVAESKQLAGLVETKPSGPIQGGLDQVLDITKGVKTLWDEIKNIFDEPREVIKEEPRAGYPDGRDVQHYNESVDRGADVVQRIAVQTGQLIDQVKGLFSLGYPQTQPQPTGGVTGELMQPAIPVGLVAVALLVLLLVRK